LKDVYIVGIAQMPVNKDPEVRARTLGATVVRDALEHGRVAADRVDALYVGNMMTCTLAHQQQLGGLIADYAGLCGVEATTIEAACASGGAAARMAYLSVAGGMQDVVVACGLERMTHVDRETITRALATAADWELEGRHGESFLSLNAKLMHVYMDRFGTRPEQFAPFSIYAHRNAVTNPNALLRKAVDLETYSSSRMIVEPLRKFDVSPICNGAAAVVLANAETAAALSPDGPRVRVASSASATDSLALARRRDLLHFDAVERSTLRAFADAGITHRDVDIFELHDAYTIITALSLEAAGFAARGQGTQLGAEGRIALEGDLPIATFGGLKARGHPVGATGIYQMVEAYLQLTGRAGANQVASAQVALVQNMGGVGATVVSHVLRRE
jgi:acetyl-CoA C-acetyltransferase